jgi:hypothetical protein
MPFPWAFRYAKEGLSLTRICPGTMDDSSGEAAQTEVKHEKINKRTGKNLLINIPELSWQKI